MRWGLDAEHRARYGMAEFAQNTWSAGLDRLLLGVTMDESEERFIGTALPLDDVDSSDVDLIGRLAECVDRIRTITDSFAVAKSLPAWCDELKRAIELLTSVTTADSWQVAHAYAEISALAPAASDSARAAGRARPGRGVGAARRRVPRSGQSGQLPYRHADHLHHAPDAIRAPSGDLPARRG